MTSRRRTIDFELLILLVVLILLATAAQSTGRSLNPAEADLTNDAANAVTASQMLDASANPYWAPAHAFARRPLPVYSDEAAPADSPAAR
ncbi:MAG: hypothetical protein R6W76_14875 [Caldilinea sp.]